MGAGAGSGLGTKTLVGSSPAVVDIELAAVDTVSEAVIVVVVISVLAAIAEFTAGRAVVAGAVAC